MRGESFHEWLRHEAETYNAPPPVPADAIWARVSSDIDRIVAANVAQMPAAEARPRRYIAGWYPSRAMMGTGFAMMLVFGIVIGRWMLPAHPAAARESRVAAASVPANAPPAPLPLQDDQMWPQHRMVLPSFPLEDGQAPHPVPLTRVVNTSKRMIRMRDPGSTYLITTQQHFANAEALLTAFETDTKVGRVDPRIAYWAQDLLSTTRVLYDAPVTRDPQLKSLLADLELVLMQLATYEPGRKADLGYAAEALDQSAILPRLRKVSNL